MTVPPHPALSPLRGGEGNKDYLIRWTLVCIRPYGFVGRLQALDGDAFGLTGLDDALLVRGDALRGFGDPRGDIGGDHDNPVLVAVQQAAGIDPHASHLHRDPEVDQVDVGVRHGYVRGAELKT